MLIKKKEFCTYLSDEQLKEIKNLLSQYFADKVTNQMDQLFEANNWGEEQIEKWSNEHMRTKYED
ncbi:MAG: hypothetical protein AB8E82_13010 [Aureispira sp.]